MNRLFKLQKALMKVLGVRRNDALTLYDDKVVAGAITGVASEANEMLDVIFADSMKPWKRQDEDARLSHLKEEWIDILFMWMEAGILMGLDEKDVETLYLEKLEANLTRAQLAPVYDEQGMKRLELADQMKKALREEKTKSPWN